MADASETVSLEEIEAALEQVVETRKASDALTATSDWDEIDRVREAYFKAKDDLQVLAPTWLVALCARVRQGEAAHDETLRVICNILPAGSPLHDAAHSSRLADSAAGVLHLVHLEIERREAETDRLRSALLEAHWSLDAEGRPCYCNFDGTHSDRCQRIRAALASRPAEIAALKAIYRSAWVGSEQEVVEALRTVRFSGGTGGLVALPLADEVLEKIAIRVWAAIEAASSRREDDFQFPQDRIDAAMRALRGATT